MGKPKLSCWRFQPAARERSRQVHVLDIDHRSEIYHRPQR
jgi:hypothetical protein